MITRRCRAGQASAPSATASSPRWTASTWRCGRGELLALLGPNGAGKTTAIGLLLGLIRADSRHGRAVRQDPQQIDARRRIGVMLQNADAAADAARGRAAAADRQLLPRARAAWPRAPSWPASPICSQRPYAKLSGGQQRRVQFALALCGRPELLFLDEPTVGMDIEARQTLVGGDPHGWSPRAARCVLTTHYLEEAEALADRVCVIDAWPGASTKAASMRCAPGRTEAHPLPHAALSADAVGRLAGGGRGRIATATGCMSPRPMPRRVVRRLLDADATLAELEVQRAGLAEAFTELTRDADQRRSTSDEAA